VLDNNSLKRVRQIKYVWALLILLFVTACSCLETPPPAEPVTIIFNFPDAEAAYYEALITEFNELYPHITIEDIRDFDDDTEVDVFFISPFGLSDFLESETLLSLTPVIQQDDSFDLDDFYPATLELFTRDDRLWAIPSGVTVRVFYYNQDLFDQYDVPYPQPDWTWSDFLDKAQALRDPQADVFGYGYADQYLDPLTFIYQNGGGILDDMQNPTRMTFDDPRTIEAMEWYAALIYDHNVAPRRGQFYAIGGNVRAGVYLNQVGMWMGWIDERGGSDVSTSDWPGEWKMRWGIVPLPRGEQAAVLAAANGYAISADTPHPEICWQLITFLSNQIRTPFDMIPARKSLAESDEYRVLVGDNVVSVARSSLEDAVLLSPTLIEFGDISIYGRAIDAIVTGNVPAQEALTRAQKQAEGGE
jgi:multiple sugar transport system substrate-binding protein